MVCVFDNVLSELERTTVRDYFLSFNASTKFEWADGTCREIILYGSPLSKLLQIVETHVDLSKMVGCEYWSHLNTKTGWHKDTDETFLYRDGVEKFPICSCVYYPEVDVQLGGDLVFETMRIKPVTNRLVIFAPNILHAVESFTGKRLAIAVNPWGYKLEHACQPE
jgi:hypothetical protein